MNLQPAKTMLFTSLILANFPLFLLSYDIIPEKTDPILSKFPTTLIAKLYKKINQYNTLDKKNKKNFASILGALNTIQANITIPNEGKPDFLNFGIFDPNNANLVYVSDYKSVKLYDITNQIPIKQKSWPISHGITNLNISTDGKHIITAGNHLTIIDVETGSQHIIENHAYLLSNFGLFTPSNSNIVIGTYSYLDNKDASKSYNCIALWDLRQDNRTPYAKYPKNKYYQHFLGLDVSSNGMNIGTTYFDGSTGNFDAAVASNPNHPPKTPIHTKCGLGPLIFNPNTENSFLVSYYSAPFSKSTISKIKEHTYDGQTIKTFVLPEKNFQIYSTDIDPNSSQVVASYTYGHNSPYDVDGFIWDYDTTNILASLNHIKHDEQFETLTCKYSNDGTKIIINNPKASGIYYTPDNQIESDKIKDLDKDQIKTIVQLLHEYRMTCEKSSPSSKQYADLQDLDEITKTNLTPYINLEH